jgi:hypothetical protein
MLRAMMRPSKSLHPSSDSVTVSPFSSTKGRQFCSTQHETGGTVNLTEYRPYSDHLGSMITIVWNAHVFELLVQG